MNTMIRSMFSDPFEMMGQNALVPDYRGLHGANDMPVSLFDPQFGRFGFVSTIEDSWLWVINNNNNNH